MDKYKEYSEYLDKIGKVCTNRALNYLKCIFLDKINYNFFKNNKNRISIIKREIIEITDIKINKNNIKTNKTKDQLENKIAHFFKIINKNLKKSNLVSFYNNFANLKIEDFNKDKKNKEGAKILGTYETLKNKIIINENFEPLTLYHELFHMASSKINKDEIISGFHYANYTKKISVGYGINEGY